MVKSKYPSSFDEGILRIVSSIPLPSEVDRARIILSGVDPQAADIETDENHSSPKKDVP